MSFQTPITIKEAVEKIDTKRYLLPAIQREVVWGCERIEKLFDSIMRDYPFGSLLFWNVERRNTMNYQFYEFMRDFSALNNKHNPKANVTGQDDITGVLDGQQRLTALYVGLKGSYAYKEPRRRWNNAGAFPRRRLYLNILSEANEDRAELFYDFQFLTDEESKVTNDDTVWFRVGDILGFKDQVQVNDYLIQEGLMALKPEKKSRFANKTLFKLREVVHDTKLINFFLEQDSSLEKVLQIFVRVNSGGISLDHSDLLLSVATAQWKNRDARDEIYRTVDELNAKGNGFNLNKDVVLKTALVVCDFADIAFKADNFNKANMLKMETEWDTIKRALMGAVDLAATFGFNRETLTSNNALIPIAYYLLKNENPKNFGTGKQFAEDRERIRRWLILSLVKRSFGGKPDNVLLPIREIIGLKNTAFPINEIRDKFKGTTKSLEFTPDEIENLLELRYGEPYTFALLALLYPTLDFRNLFHVDHMHPRSGFTRAKLLKKRVKEDQVESFVDWADALPNLQLLEGGPNQQKSDTDFSEWFKDNVTAKGDQAETDYKVKHYLPNTGFLITDFEQFFEGRKTLLRNALKKLLGVQ